MNASRQIAVIAPEQMRSAFAVLIDSAPDDYLLASATSLDELIANLGTGKPDVVLIYLVRENRAERVKPAYEVIPRVKQIWPDSLCVTIVEYTSQLDKVKEIGSDLALVEGVNAEKVLAAIAGKLT